jgi:hypothetical protein
MPVTTGFDDQYRRALTLQATHKNVHLIEGEQSEQLADAILRYINDPPIIVDATLRTGAQTAARYLIELSEYCEGR